MEETLQRIDTELLMTLLEYLDPFSKYQLGKATRGADLTMTSVIATSLLSVSLPSNIVPIGDPRDIFTEDISIASPESWRRKKALIHNLLVNPPKSWHYRWSEEYPTEIEKLLVSKSWDVFGGGKVEFNRDLANIVSKLVTEIASATAQLSFFAFGQWQISQKKVKYACERLNLQMHYGPAERMFESPFFSYLLFPDEVTLNELASLRFDRFGTFEEIAEEQDKGDRILLDSWDPKWPSYQDEVLLASKKLIYLRKRVHETLGSGPDQVLVDDRKYPDLYDPYYHLERDAEDFNWEDWIASLDIDEEEAPDTYHDDEGILEQVKAGLDDLIVQLGLNNPESQDDNAKRYFEPSQCKLDRQEFFEAFQSAVWDYKTDSPCSPSATTYAQRITEDFAFGCAVKLFW